MTAGAPPLGNLLPSPNRRGPGRYVVQTTKGATSYATTRVLGMWVPAEAFRAGSFVMISGSSQTASPILTVGIGGRGSAVGGGVSFTYSTGPAVACHFRLTLQQETDGCIATFRTSGQFVGSTSAVHTTASGNIFLQPLNFVEVGVTGTFTLDNVTMELYVPQRTRHKAHHETLAV